jgi:hypothetical protein
VAVPEAAFHFDYHAMLFQDYIGTSRQAGIVQAEAVTEAV